MIENLKNSIDSKFNLDTTKIIEISKITTDLSKLD